MTDDHLSEKPAAHSAPSLHPLSERLREEIAANAELLDRGERDTRPVLSALAGEGLLDLGAPHNHSGGLEAMAAVVSTLAERCMSSAFTTWAHRMTIEYLAASPTPYASRVLPRLRSGRTCGITGMASSFRDLAGCGALELTAVADGDGYLLNGPIRWASNLFPDAVLVTGARTADGDRIIVVLPLSTPGIEVGKSFPLLALGSTSSSFLSLTDVRVGAEQVLTTDFEAFLTSVRPTFMVLQSAMCIGLARTCLTNTQASMSGTNSVFTEELTSLIAKLSRVDQEVVKAARSVGEPVAPTRAQLLTMRLGAAELATGAAALEAKTAGGRGYVGSSAVSRRYREAAFLPVQSPSESQLRWELAACGR
jgi:alkylation response protein AidB-like acyl-CoA dehydrogenase